MWAAMDALPMGLVVAGADGRVARMNQAAARLAEGGVRTALAWQAVTDLIGAVLADGRARREEFELMGPPSQTLVIEASAAQTGAGAVAVIRDISEVRQLEGVRRDFIANVSHELRTPIGAIAVLADTLAGAPDADDVERLARRVRSEASRLSELVEDLLDLSRIEAVRPDPSGPPVDLAAVISRAVERCKQVCEVCRVAVQVTTDPAAQQVSGDEGQLVSAVSNLIENAAKYSGPDQSVEIELRASEPGRAAIAVRDQGIGIPSWEQERIFERFYRVDRARARNSGGTGLGLAIVRNVAANHGGTVTVESREGEGSTFTIYLPVAADAT